MDHIRPGPRGARRAAIPIVSLIVVLAVRLPAGPANAASGGLAVVQSFGAASSSAATGLSAQPSSATSTGDLLVAGIRDRNTTARALVTGVTDSAGNTWVRATGVTQGTQADEEIWYAANAAAIGTSGSVTVTLGAASALAFTVLDVTGASSTPLDVAATAAGSGSAAVTGTTATTAQAGEIAVAAIGWNASVTPGGQTAGYTTTTTEQSTVSGSAAGEQAAWQVLGATGTQGYAATLSSSVAWTGAIATFEMPSGSPTPTPTPTSTPTPTPTPTPPPQVPHIMVIVEENQEYSGIIGSSSAPYLNSLAATYTSATKWYAVQHNSPHDYLDLVSGSDWNLGTARPPFAGPTVVDELAGQGTGWRAYMEDAPSACYTGGDVAGYMKVHNPFVDFSTILGSPSQCGSVVPFAGHFASDLSGGTAPPFLFVVPNSCDDMHGGNPPAFTCSSNNAVALGDQWLSANLPTVLNSSWYRSGGVVIITWDEGTTKKGFNGGNGGHIATLVIASNAHGAYTAGGDHFGTLRGIEEAYNVGLLGASASALNGDLQPAF